MDVRLNPHEARVLGVLIEKELTTPDGYPLSLNAATAGANQKSNRHPVADWVEAEVDVALQGLVMKGLAGRVSGGRVEKFRHNARERLGVSDGPLAVLAELLLRGAQQPGELRGRAARMHAMATQQDLSQHLAVLIERGLARRLPPAPGSRAERYAQLLAPDGAPETHDAAPQEAPAPAPRRAPVQDDRTAALEQEVARLRRAVEHLARSLGVELPE